MIVSVVLLTSIYAQTPEKIHLKLKNNGLLPREFRFLERHPTDKFPNVFTAYILPGQSYTVKLKVGTSLALVTQAEINAVMRGNEVPGKPLLVVKADDNGKIFKLN